MSRAVTTVITTLLLVFVLVLTAQRGISQEQGEGKMQMKMQMKGMEDGSMKDGPSGKCMQPMGEPPSANSTGKVVILEPDNGTVIKSRTVKVVFDIPEKGSAGNHLHIYLDGRCRNMIRSGKTHYLSGLREGKHKIELRLVSKNHHEYGVSASVEITVKRK